jgi:hypothetical protein
VIYWLWPFKVRIDAQLLACFVVDAFLFFQIFLFNLAFRWSSGNGGIGYEATSTGILPPKSLLRDMIAHCGR